MTKIIVKNICNDQRGAFYHSESYSPHSHTLPFEPYIGDIQLKLDEIANVDLSILLKNLKYYEELRDARIIDFSIPVETKLIENLESFSEAISKFAEIVSSPAQKFHEDFKEKIEVLKEANIEMTEIMEKAIYIEDEVQQLSTDTKEVSEKLEQIFGPPVEIKEEEFTCGGILDPKEVEQLIEKKEEPIVNKVFNKAIKKKKR